MPLHASSVYPPMHCHVRMLFILPHACRYDVTEALVGHPPAPMELDVTAGQTEGEKRKVLLDTPNADLLDALSRLVTHEIFRFRLYVGGY